MKEEWFIQPLIRFTVRMKEECFVQLLIMFTTVMKQVNGRLIISWDLLFQVMNLGLFGL